MPRPPRPMPDVVDVVQFKTPMREGVAVLAKDIWTAKKARDAVKVEWDETNAFVDGLGCHLRAVQGAGAEAGPGGQQGGRCRQGARRRCASASKPPIEFPFLAHASMEPMNCVVQLKAGGCEIWNGEQMHTPDQGVMAGSSWASSPSR